MEPNREPATGSMPHAPGAPDGPVAPPAVLSGGDSDVAARLFTVLIVVLAVVLAASIARLAVLLLQRNTVFIERAVREVAQGTARYHVSAFAGAIGLVFVAMCVDVFAHESGHVLGAALVGFRFVSVRFGVLNVRRTRRGLRLSLSFKNWSGGAAVYYPVSTSDMRLRYSLSVALGPMASLLLAFGAAALLDSYVSHAGGSLSAPNPTVVLLLTSIGVFSLCSFVENLIPLKFRHVRNDGRRLLTMALGGPRCERMLLLALLYGYHQRKVPPREQPAWAILRLLALSRDSDEEMFASICAYSWALDSRDVAHAAVYLECAIAAHRAPSKPKATLAHEIAFFTARYHRRPDIARTWLAHGAGDRFGAFMRPRAEAAILLAEGRYAEASECAGRGLAAWERYVQTADHFYRMEERDLRELLTEARQVGSGSE